MDLIKKPSSSIKFKLLFLLVVPIAMFALLFFFYFLPTYYDDIYDSKTNQVQDMVESGMGVLRYYHKLEKQGPMSRKEAQGNAQAILSEMTFSERSLNYYWIHDRQPRLVMHPYLPEAVGKDISELNEMEGPDYVEKIFEVLEKQDEGFMEYNWQYYDHEDRLEPKLSYVKTFEPWGWVLGTGVYVNDVEQATARTRNNFIIALVLLTLFILIAGYYFIRRSIMFPLARVVEAITSMSRGELAHKKIEEGTSDEIGQLRVAFNSLIDALDKLRKQAKDFDKDKSVIEKIKRFNWSNLTDGKNTSLPGELNQLSVAFNMMNSSLKETTLFLRKIIDSMSEMLIIADGNGRIQEVNQTVIDSLGYSRRELEDKQSGILVVSSQQQEFEKMCADNNCNRSEYVFQKKSGGVLAVLCNVTKIEITRSKANFCLYVATDISELNQKQKHLQAANQQLEATEQQLRVEVAERKQVESEVRKQKNMYRAVVNTHSDAVCRWLPDTTLTFANDAYLEMFGLEESDIGIFKWKKFLPEEERAETLVFYENIASQDPPTSTDYEHRVKLPDGTTREYHWVDEPVLDKSGNLIEWQSVGRDITDQKKTQEELQKKSKKLEAQKNKIQAILEALPDLCFVIDKEGKYLQVTTKQQDRLVAPAQELLDSTVQEQLPPEIAQKIMESIRKSLKQNSIQEIDYPLKVPAGKLYLQARVSPVSKTEVVFLSRDITEIKRREQQLEASEQQLRSEIEARKQIAEELKRSEQFLRDVTDRAPTVIYVSRVNSGGEVSFDFVSGYIQKFTGYSPREVENNFDLAWERVLSEDVAKLQDSIMSVFRDNKEWEHEFRIRNPLGQIKWLRGVSRPYGTNEADESVSIGFLSDITELKEQEKKLKRSNTALRQFANVASHDLKEPLRTITSYAELLVLEKEEMLDSSALEYIRSITSGTRKMKKILDELLVYAKLKTTDQNFESVELAEIVAQVCDELEKLISENDAEIIFSNLPKVKGDKNLLTSLFRNLVSNSIVYRSEEPPRIKIDAEPNKNRVKVSISDNGIGIAPEHTGKIFDIFKRLHTDEEVEGTGIGLAVCKKIVNEHQGEIHVESEPGEGAIFYFTLPAV